MSCIHQYSTIYWRYSFVYIASFMTPYVVGAGTNKWWLKIVVCCVWEPTRGLSLSQIGPFSMQVLSALSVLSELFVWLAFTACCKCDSHWRLSCSSLDINVCDWPRLVSLKETFSKLRAEINIEINIKTFLLISLRLFPTLLGISPHHLSWEIPFLNLIPA